MDIAVIENYMMKLGRFSVAQVQSGLNAWYADVVNTLKRLQGEGRVKEVDELLFEYVPAKGGAATDGACARPSIEEELFNFFRAYRRSREEDGDECDEEEEYDDEDVYGDDEDDDEDEDVEEECETSKTPQYSSVNYTALADRARVNSYYWEYVRVNQEYLGIMRSLLRARLSVGSPFAEPSQETLAEISRLESELEKKSAELKRVRKVYEDAGKGKFPDAAADSAKKEQIAMLARALRGVCGLKERDAFLNRALGELSAHGVGAVLDGCVRMRGVQFTGGVRAEFTLDGDGVFSDGRFYFEELKKRFGYRAGYARLRSAARRFPMLEIKKCAFLIRAPKDGADGGIYESFCYLYDAISYGLKGLRC